MRNLNLHYLKATHNLKVNHVINSFIMRNLNLHYLKATHNKSPVVKPKQEL